MSGDRDDADTWPVDLALNVGCGAAVFTALREVSGYPVEAGSAVAWAVCAAIAMGVSGLLTIAPRFWSR